MTTQEFWESFVNLCLYIWVILSTNYNHQQYHYLRRNLSWASSILFYFMSVFFPSFHLQFITYAIFFPLFNTFACNQHLFIQDSHARNPSGWYMWFNFIHECIGIPVLCCIVCKSRCECTWQEFPQLVYFLSLFYFNTLTRNQQIFM
jgi:hypothetical protein